MGFCRYWVVLGVLGGTGDQKRLLWGTAWYCWVLLGTGVHLWVLRVLGLLPVTVGYFGKLLGTGGTRE